MPKISSLAAYEYYYSITQKCLIGVQLAVLAERQIMVARVYAHTEDDMFIVVRQIVGDALQLGSRLESLERDTPLVGNLPELDSMAVVTVITALEEHFSFVVDDDDDVSQAFDTLGCLTEYVDAKAHR